MVKIENKIELEVDTETSLDEIEAEFGPEVRHIVDQVTDDKTLEKMERKRLQIEVVTGKNSYVPILLHF